MSHFPFGRMVLGHLAAKYSQEAAYYTVLPDVPTPPVDSRRCRNYWETQKRLLTHQIFCARQDYFHHGSRITSARGNYNFENVTA
jgi:hypothetical protein